MIQGWCKVEYTMGLQCFPSGCSLLHGCLKYIIYVTGPAKTDWVSTNIILQCSKNQFSSFLASQLVWFLHPFSMSLPSFSCICLLKQELYCERWGYVEICTRSKTNHLICYTWVLSYLVEEIANRQDRVVAALNFLMGEGIDYHPDGCDQETLVLINDYFSMPKWNEESGSSDRILR